jgi:hypothetical protein
MERALFGALTGGARALLATEEGFELNTLPAGTPWLIKVGEPNVEGLPPALFSGSGYSLYFLGSSPSTAPRKTNLVDFSNPCPDASESSWSCGAETEVRLSSTIPQRAQIDILVNVSGLASKGELEFVVGDSVLVGQIPQGGNSLSLQFTNSTEADFLTIRHKGEKEDGSKFVQLVSVILAD